MQDHALARQPNEELSLGGEALFRIFFDVKYSYTPKPGAESEQTHEFVGHKRRHPVGVCSIP